MPEYNIKFRPFVTSEERKDFTTELSQYGGQLVKDRRFRNGSIYELPDESLDIQRLRTHKFVDSSVKHEE